MDSPDFMEEARAIAAQCWCDPETSHIPMDVVLAEAVARRIAAWMNTAAFHAQNEEYWRDQVKSRPPEKNLTKLRLEL